MSLEMLDEAFDWEDMTTSSSSCSCYIGKFHRMNHIVSKKREQPHAKSIKTIRIKAKKAIIYLIINKYRQLSKQRLEYYQTFFMDNSSNMDIL